MQSIDIIYYRYAPINFFAPQKKRNNRKESRKKKICEKMIKLILPPFSMSSIIIND